MVKTKKRMRRFIAVLVSSVCINGILIIATMISTAAEIPAVSVEEALEFNKATTTQASDTTAVLAKAAIAPTTKNEPNAMAKTTTSTTATPKTTTTTTTKTSNTTTNDSETSNTTTSTAGISTLRNSVHPALMNAFDQLEFVIRVNPESTYLGYFSANKHLLEMRSISVSTFRHEMGHFLDVLKNMPSKSNEFAGIYAKEKSKYSGTNITYITGSAQEYFAQSYRNYLEDRTKLKAERPLTYDFIQKQIAGISTTDINRTYNSYCCFW